ncbi:unnamed protein product [Medioppia subpectinata]|uniref:RNF34/RFFL HeH domain-containing protein n=1 Tax=Medioppia subpectinata TaxID=1979941 RepID=A0A7R9KPM2_9ACAR|nr:unnamed protein product [Medioppia subpectinata]CAG2107462.1 unnamed protein product [Medioppia subpectinata]
MKDHNESGSRGVNRTANSGLNFDFPSLNLDFHSISEALSPRNLSTNWDQLMAATKCGTNRPKDIACQSCSIKFTVFKRKRTCIDCNMDFCNQCLNKDLGYDRKNHCKRCVVFSAVPLDRNALNGLRARDLKWFLASKRIPSQMCNEKGELVDLIIQSFSPQSNASSESSQFMRPFDRETRAQPTNDNQSESQSQTQSHNNVEPLPIRSAYSPVYPSLNSLNTNSNPINDSNAGSSESVNTKPESTPNKSNTYFNIDDLKSMDQLKALSVKQLKLILTRNFIDYKGCVEKEELLSKVERLWNDRQENKTQNLDDIPDSNVCKICMESTIDCVLLGKHCVLDPMGVVLQLSYIDVRKPALTSRMYSLNITIIMLYLKLMLKCINTYSVCEVTAQNGLHLSYSMVQLFIEKVIRMNRFVVFLWEII